MNAPANLPLSEQIYRAGIEWADAYAAAQLLEEGKSAFTSQRMTAEGDIPVSKAERIVKSSPEYSDYIKKMVAARTHANKSKIYYEYMKAKLTEWISADANNRMQARV